jgi:hypothetical protein
MFATLIHFEGEDEGRLAAGISHVEEEVLPAMRATPGIGGVWLVDRENGQRITLMVADDQDAFDAAMARVAEARAAQPDRERPVPSSVARYDVYGRV